MCLRPAVPSESSSRQAETEAFKQRIESTNAAERENGLQGIVAFAETEGKTTEPFTVPLLPVVLKALADKVNAVKSVP